MQPFIIPEAEANTKTPDLQSMNHDHGPTPFEKGYAMGTQNSTALKNKMNHIMKSFRFFTNNSTIKYLNNTSHFTD